MTRQSIFFERFRSKLKELFGRTFIITLLLFLFFVTLGGISHSEKWRILRVDITGANTISKDDVRASATDKILGNYFFVYARDNSYLFPNSEIEHALLEQFPRILSVHAVRTDVNSIVINIIERKPYALWCGDLFLGVEDLTNCWFIDSTGYIFDKAPVFSDGVYFEMYGKLAKKSEGEILRASLPHDRFLVTNTFVKLLHEQVGETLRANLKDNEETEITLRTSSRYPFLAGTIIRFTTANDPATLIKNLLSTIQVQFPNGIALKKKLLYIDMRFGNKIFFGYEN